ncbi:cupin domain-containing protein [Haloferacaceae archaeon DSL9]
MPTIDDIAVVSATDGKSRGDAPRNLAYETVIETADTLLIRVTGDTSSPSGWHSHDGRVAYGVVLDGRLRLEYGSDGGDHVGVATGEFFLVPAGATYRVVPRGETDPVAMIALVGEGAAATTERDAPTREPSQEIRVAGEDDLVPTTALQNLVRLTPFPDAPVQQVRGHASGRIASEWHHHGDNDVFGCVLDGEGYVEWGSGDGERKIARSGDAFRVPAGVVHRDVNPSDDEQDYVLWLTGSEPRTVRVDEPSSE